MHSIPCIPCTCCLYSSSVQIFTNHILTCNRHFSQKFETSPSHYNDRQGLVMPAASKELYKIVTYPSPSLPAHSKYKRHASDCTRPPCEVWGSENANYLFFYSIFDPLRAIFSRKGPSKAHSWCYQRTNEPCQAAPRRPRLSLRDRRRGSQRHSGCLWNVGIVILHWNAVFPLIFPLGEFECKTMGIGNEDYQKETHRPSAALCCLERSMLNM